jgi:hypothetical protein
MTPKRSFGLGPFVIFVSLVVLVSKNGVSAPLPSTADDTDGRGAIRAIRSSKDSAPTPLTHRERRPTPFA